MLGRTVDFVATKIFSLASTLAGSKAGCAGFMLVVSIGVKTMAKSKDAYAREARAEINRITLRRRLVLHQEIIRLLVDIGTDLPNIERLAPFVGDDPAREGDKNAVVGDRDW